MSRPENDFLSELYQQLNSQHESEREQLLSRIADAKQISVSEEADNSSGRIASPQQRIGRRLVSLASAAAVLLVVGAVIFFTGRTAGGIAFADVIRHFEQSESFTYTVIYKMPGAPDSVSYTSRFDSREISREEALELDVHVYDARTGQPVGMVPIGTVDGGELPETVRTPNQEYVPRVKPTNVAWVQSLRRRVGQERRIGERQLAGKDVIGFQVRDEGQAFSLWAEKQTGVPVELEIESDAKPGKTILTDFVWNTYTDEQRADK